MGHLSDAMQAVVDEITESTQSRRHRLHELRDETTEGLTRWRSERRATAQALREQFDAHRADRAAVEQTRVKAAHQLMEAIQQGSTQRRVLVSELRSNAHNLVNRFGLEHRDMARALQEKLASEVNTLKDGVKEMIDELAADLRQTHQIWAEGLKKKLAPEAATAAETVVVKKPKVETIPSLSEEAESIEVEEIILEIIARHSEGIKLVEIGNELGVDWRTLIGPSKFLVDEGKVEKIDNLYYPRKS